jgi:hypothetical protein
MEFSMRHSSIRKSLAVFLALSVSAVFAGAGSVSANDGPSPLSGLPGGAGKKVVMVKYGNAKPDRPHYGLNQADLFYVEEVEWGLTRIAAMFNTKFPAVVGPTRSARISDLEILEQFDKPGLVYSGANDELLKRVRKSNAISMSPSDRSQFYYRNLSKQAPHNQLARLSSMMAAETKVGAIKDVGLTFDRTAPAGGKKAKSFRAAWPASRVSGVWNGSVWVVSMDGSTHRDAQNKSLLTPKTVVIQYVEQKESAFGDRFGGKTPLIKTVGAGNAVVLRNGTAYDATWSRPTRDSGTVFSAGGVALPFDVGQVMVLLVSSKAKKGSVVVE